MTGRPPKHRCLIKLDEAKITTGGIILPPELLKSNTGLVVQSGIEGLLEGQRIALDDHPLEPITLPEGEFISVHKDHILMVL